MTTLPPEDDVDLWHKHNLLNPYMSFDEWCEYVRKEKETKWQSWYKQYLDSPEWKSRRKLVLERDNYLCQACRQDKATQVHHLTYNRVGNEPLFDLVSVCKDCHKKLHNK